MLWISTLHGELFRANPFKRTIPFYPSSDGPVFSFYEGANGTLWIGTENGGLFQHDPRKGTLKRLLNDSLNKVSPSNNAVMVLKADHQGNIWIGTSNGLLLLDKKKGTFTRYGHDPKISGSLSNNFVRCIYEDSKKNLWIGTARGLNQINRKTGSFNLFLFYPKDTFWLGPNLIASVLEDRQGQIWACCYEKGGIHQLNPANGKFKTFLKGISIFCVYEDANGTLWAGGDNGLFHYNRKSDTFDKFVDLNEPTEINRALSIIEDDQRNLWIGTIDGLLKINPQRNQTTLYGKHYGVDGNALIFNSAYKRRDGKLYFGHARGYHAFYPHLLTKGLKPPEILFSGFRLSDRLVQPDKNGPLKEPFSLVKKIRLHHNQNIFSFDFAAIDYTNPEANRHYFMLENYDKNWNQAGSDRRAIYFNVPPGKYVFRVKAANSNSLWAEKSIDVIITPPWWSNWWFRIAAVIFIVAALYGFIRWRLHEKFKLQLEKAERNKQLAELKHKTAELEMQALRAQMNPHFIFNCLSSINRFILKNESEAASDYLTKFSRLIRMVLTNSKKTFITLEDELETLRLYLEMERLRFGYAFDFNISFKNEIDPENIFIPPLLLQPFAENAIWHGLMHKQDQGHLEIELNLNEDILTCIITDNGIGRSKAAIIKSKSTEKQKSMGLQITTERLALLNHDSNERTFFTIQDLTDDNGEPAGTQVTLKIHYRDMMEAPVEL